MFKKMIFTAGAGLMLLGLIFGRDVFSYVGTSVGWVHDTVRQQVPVDFELQRARKMIEDLAPEVKKNMHAIAREEIEIERLAAKIEKLQERQAKGEIALKKFHDALEAGHGEVQFGTTRYTSTEASELARSRFDRFKTDAETLHNLQRVLAARDAGLKAARKKLDATLAAKQQLLAEVASLEARQTMTEVSQATGTSVQFDDSHLARTRKLIDQLETRIKVEERLAESEINFTDEMLLDGESADGDIAADLAEYFGSGPAPETFAEAELDLDSQL